MAPRETALVTGASGGIGRVLAETFARNDFDLIVVARRQQELEKLGERCRSRYGSQVTVLPMDLLTAGAAEKLVGQVEAAGLRVDALVNNAGLMDMGDFSEIDVERHERLLQLNVVLLASLTRRLLPAMIARGQGRILNLASTSAFQPLPALALYAASKAFVLSFSESLSEELAGTGVTVTALCPGFTKTEMLDQAKDQHAFARNIPGFLISDVESVAQEGFEACIAGHAILVPGLANRLGASLVQLQPRWLVRTLAGVIGRRAT